VQAVRGSLGSGLSSWGGGRVQGHTELRHAKGFSIEYRKDCKIIRVHRPWSGAKVGVTYVLVPRGTRPDQMEAGARIIEIPVRRAIALGTPQAPVFLRLGVPETLVAMAGVRLLQTPELVAQAQAGRLLEISDGSQGMDKKLDLERIRMINPDLIVASGSGNPALNEHGKLLEAGFPVVFQTEWLEETPLGRAEWIKFGAAFLDKEQEAEALFKGIEARYVALKAKAAGVSRRPTVLMGTDYRGTWHMSGGRSYVAQFIEDAGGDYLWKDALATGSLPLKMEAVLERARKADLWILHMSAARSREDLVQADERHRLFEAFHGDRIWNNDLKVGPSGGNDYWENGVHRPDLVLAELIAILHPELMPGHAFQWYRKMP
jgi:iron complex transport system substrate-binding protein